MNDNEKLDNQRLKNFKNKGRDLEVSTRSSIFFSALCLRWFVAPVPVVTSFVIHQDFRF